MNNINLKIRGMNTLEKLNKRLNNNQNLFIDVYDNNNLKKLDKNQNANSILLFHNSFYDYYKSFYKKGFQEIRIIAKTKISKYYKRKEMPVIIVFEERIQHGQQQNNNIQQLAKFTKGQFNLGKIKKVKYITILENYLDFLENKLSKLT